MDENMRINKFLSECGFCSRREADRLLEAGKVTVDGETASLGSKIVPGQEVKVEGVLVTKKDVPFFCAPINATNFLSFVIKFSILTEEYDKSFGRPSSYDQHGRPG